jgi:hypothetical protein
MKALLVAVVKEVLVELGKWLIKGLASFKKLKKKKKENEERTEDFKNSKDDNIIRDSFDDLP